MSEQTAQADPAPPSTAEKLARRRKRIRNWATLIALFVLAGLVYGIAILRMIEQHRLPHFV